MFVAGGREWGGEVGSTTPDPPRSPPLSPPAQARRLEITFPDAQLGGQRMGETGVLPHMEPEADEEQRGQKWGGGR